jgi:hypothetical protein
MDSAELQLGVKAASLMTRAGFRPAARFAAASQEDSYQGTTSVVPQRVENRSWALAAALPSTQKLSLYWSFSAACSVMP